MSKQISNGELAEIVTGLLVGRLGPEQLDSPELYSAFMTQLAKLVCDFCGGTVSAMPADNTCEQWLIGINSNECLPEDGGVWGKYDSAGELGNQSSDNSNEQFPTAVVWIDGGVVQWVASDFPMRYLVLDADTDGSNQTMEITMEDGSVADVLHTPHTLMADCLPSWVSSMVTKVESQN